MSVVRSDEQVALNDLHVALLHGADNLRDCAEFLADDSVSGCLRDIAAERETLAQNVATAIKVSGDLPSVPDTDRETGEQLLQHLSALFAEDETAGVLRQRQEAEGALLEQIDSADMACLESSCAGLLQECREHIRRSLEQLSALSADS